MLLCALALPAAGQQRSSETLASRGAVAGWEAVGRLDMRGGFCTAALVRPDVVMTAAHCVTDPQTRALRPASDFVFRAGYYLGRAIATRRVTHVVVPAGYKQAALAGQAEAAIALDLALLRLDRPLMPVEVKPLALNEVPFKGTPVALVSYGKGRAEALTFEEGCQLTGRYRGNVLGFDCRATFGSSGAPVLVRDGGGYRILSVVSSVAVTEDERLEVYGMVLPRLVSTLMKGLGREVVLPPVSRGVRRIGAGERDGTGARFVRP